MRTGHRPWTIEEVKRARELRADGRRPWLIVGQIMDRHPENCRKRVSLLNRGRYPPAEPLDRTEYILAINTDDAGHVRACLQSGGFGRIPLAWNQPARVWRAA